MVHDFHVVVLVKVSIFHDDVDALIVSGTVCGLHRFQGFFLAFLAGFRQFVLPRLVGSGLFGFLGVPCIEEFIQFV